MNNQVIDMTSSIQHNNVGVRKVDSSRGDFRSEVSSQWFSRPDDQKFLDLNSLHAFVKKSADASQQGIIDVSTIQVNADNDNAELLTLSSPQIGDSVVTPNNWSFGQLCSLVKAPAGYLRNLPGPIAGINMQYGISNYRAKAVQAYVTGTDEGVELRAATGPDYGRVHDWEVVEAVQRIAGNGNGDTNWKVPGVMNWRDGTYNPDSPITRDSTTLFASDRDVFLFLVDDRNPIEIGKLANGDPDLLFRGFYVWNSEVGGKSLGIACFYLRGVCQNRCLWGVEGFRQLRIRHSKGAPSRFISEAMPTLRDFSNGNTNALIEGVNAAKSARVANNDDDAIEFLAKQKFPKSTVKSIIDSVTSGDSDGGGEGHKPRTVWDFVQGITAVAREKTHQDARLDLERAAGKLLDKVA